MEEFKDSSKHFSDEKLWNKLARYAKKAGVSAIYAVLLLYYTLQKPEVPKKSKAVIIGALGYFILPFDLIPDVTGPVGYTDDVGVLLAALVQVAIYIDSDIKDQARDKLKDWFGDDIDTSEVDAKIGE
ncbi:YkvA family protein [Bacillus cereus]|uniref:DUF1232 domain-containing protein n=1 Tax=Bacillus cereus TaxID=1396 RepID=A0AA44QB50_BACCE|nr:YkvA family protein [Bacillus cereus]PFN04202.1 hypothetical protein COJ55_22600 [Bacillus cereus]PFS02556.1 hypothetical protein COK38_09210 [Bacillus cereus]